jgi:arabinofuranosyltransferase
VVSTRTHGPTGAVVLALALTGLGTGLAYWLIGMPPLLGAEDAAIGFRYARNFADGFGIVFNPGGERVEGFTSVSWLLISGTVYKLMGAAGLEVTLLLLSLGLTTFTVAAVLSVVLRHDSGWLPVAAACVWLIGQAGFYFWSGLSLMDVAPWAAGLTGYVLLIDSRVTAVPDPATRERLGLGSLVVLLVLTRPESMLVVPGALVVATLAYGPSRRLRTVAIEVIGTTVAAVGLLTIFRLLYFGYPLPNTYYVKVSPDVGYRLSGGLGYVTDYLADHPLGAVMGLVVVAVLVARIVALVRPWTSAFRSGTVSDLGPVSGPGSGLGVFAAGFIVLGFASVVYGGGDHYQGHRFLQAYLPLAAIPLAAAIRAGQERLADFRALPARWILPILIVAAALAVPSEWATYRAHGLRQQAYDVGLQGRFVGATLDEVFAGEDAPEVGLWMVGGASYTYTGPVKDLLGLNWIAMGTSPGDRKGLRDHAAFNSEVFWSAPPELMIPEPEVVLRGVRCVRAVLNGAFGGLLVSPRFEREFVPVRLVRGDTEPLIAYARLDWLVSAPAVVEPLGWSYCHGTG